MFNNLFLAGIASLLITTNTSNKPLFIPQIEQNNPKSMVNANNKFAIDLFKLSKSEENEFISPYSISSALAMTYQGASGETETCMNDVLNFTENSDEFHKGFSKLNKEISVINKTKGLEFNVANRLWGAQSYQFNDEFVKNSKSYYGAGLQGINFENTTKAAKTINTWVEDKTNDKIKDLLSPEDLIDARLVLTNAIYFNASWAIAFNKELTNKGYFHLNAEEKEIRSLMKVEGWKAKNEKSKYRYKYTEDKNVQVLEIPYSNNKASMVVVLPKDIEGLSKIVEDLNEKKYNKWVNSLKVPNPALTIHLPKWKNTSDYKLSKMLKEMGMENAFSDQADFKKMSSPSETPLKISEVIHKAFVDVSEKGTEAAAATAVIMVEIVSIGPRKKKPEPYIRFIADHPFLYFIKDNETNSILFMGQITNPKTD